MQNQLKSLRKQTVNNNNLQFKEGYYTIENETKIHSLEDIAKKNKYKFMKEGLTLIKPELVEEWIKFVNSNEKNQYFEIIIEAIVSIMNKMNNGISFLVAKHQTCVEELNLSAFQESIVTCAILHFYDNSKNSTDSIDEPIFFSYLKK